MQGIQTVWLAVCTILVFSMQAGFAMLETGFTRKKNSGNIIMKNVMDFSLGSLCYWIIGFGLMFGASKGMIGRLDFLSMKDYSDVSGLIPQTSFMVWELVFCATSTTIVSGAMAERTSFKAYLMYSAVMSALVYPISGCWIWNPAGWLHRLGFHDFAGGTAVHLLGGTAAFMGAAVLGARFGKFDSDKKSKVIRGQNIPIAALGAFLLWIGWLGFNGGSVVTSAEGFSLEAVGYVLFNTLIASSACSAASMFLTWVRYGKSDITMSLNGIIAGLVSVTAGADIISHTGAFLTGLLAAFVLVFGIEMIENVFHVDDPVGAVTVHGLCGGFGTLMVGIFSKKSGVLYTGTFDFLGIQALGVLSVLAYALVVTGILFWGLRATVGLRVSNEDEIKGLDYSEHGWPTAGDLGAFDPEPDVYEPKDALIDLDKPLPVNAYQSDGKMHKVDILMNSYRFEALKTALDAIDITGMTVTNVTGCGIQKGNTGYYRGSKESSRLLPKIKVEIIICTVPLGILIDTVKKVLYTGHIGDGKIFVYDVKNVIKIRTGEEGKAALE
jgi:Amt family ammonium transporter